MNTATLDRAIKVSHVRVARSLLREASGNRSGDGRCLVSDCLGSIPDLEEFPPSLLILLATVAFRPFEDLLSGIRAELEQRGLGEVPLVGCSVAAVHTEKEFVQKGAALVCLASRFIHARIGVAKEALTHLEEAIESLSVQLRLDCGDLNPAGNRFLLCFVPGFVETDTGIAYRAPEIHAAIHEMAGQRIPMVGGASGDDFQRKRGWQFADHQVFRHSAVVALVESDTAFRIGMRHGLEGTRNIVHVEQLAEDGRRIVRLRRGGPAGWESRPPLEIIREYEGEEPGTTILFGDMTPEDEADRIILYPQRNKEDPADESVYVGRRVKAYLPLEILKAQPDKLRSTASEMMHEALQDGYIDPFHLAGVIAFPCAARYEFADEVALDVPGALRELREQFPDVPVVGGLVFGEIGVGSSRQNVMRNWTFAGLLLADQLPRRSVERLGYTALAQAGKEMAEAQSVDEVLETAMEGIGKAGFRGGMISLVFQDLKPDSFVVVARRALSERWKRIIKPTIRRAWGGDILVLAAKSRNSEFVPNAQTDDRCDRNAAKLAEVISFHVSPLICPFGQVIGADACNSADPPEKVIGLLQVDLGDMSNLERGQLPGHLETLLQAFAGQIATALGRAIRIHELALSDLFDRAVAESLTKNSVEEAAQAFVDVVAEEKSLLGTDMMHIRLCRPGERQLRMVAGRGSYYEVARTARPAIKGDKESLGAGDGPESPSAKTFREKRAAWVNNTEEDEMGKEFVASQPTGELREVMESIQSYANLPIQRNHEDPPVGILNISATTPWFFSESLFRSMQMLGQRLYFALSRAERAEAERSQTQKVEFLLGMTPRLGTDNLRTTLRKNAEGMAKTANADVLSFFLWDPHCKALVLRGQYGWKKDQTDQARYTLKEDRIDEGRFNLEQTTMTARVACWREPDHIEDLMKWKAERRQGPSQHETEMFGTRREDACYEVIGIPLQYEGLLGVLTMHNALEANGSSSKFAVVERRFLQEVADDLSADIYAALKYEQAREEGRLNDRLRELDASLLQLPSTLAELPGRACERVLQYYDLEAATAYLIDESAGDLELVGQAGFSQMGSLPPRVNVEDTVLRGVFASKTEAAFDFARQSLEGLDHALQSQGALLTSGSVRSLLALPLCDQLGTALGTLTLWNIRNRRGEEHPWFHEGDKEHFRVVARHIGSVIKGLRQREIDEEHRREGHMIWAGTIAASLTHDIRQGVGDIGAGVREARDMSTSDEQRSLMTKVEEVCEDLADDVNRYLKVIKEGRPTLFEDALLHPIVMRAIGQCRHKAEEHKATIHPPKDCGVLVRCAAVVLGDVFFNAIDNGLNAMPEGGDLTITTRLDEEADNVFITITDEGSGLSDTQMADFREGRPLASSRGRPSMGLQISKLVIQSHHGEITLARGAEKGTTVIIKLPVARADSRRPNDGRP